MKYAVLRRRNKRPREWVQCALGNDDHSTEDKTFALTERDDYAKNYPQYLYIVVEVTDDK